ncbi:hypothetical protein NM688_g1362 [Phlebia brevispora]|uniref:Uncharacterized protein n=1 Tax=Phlebia brevispora TaxID=194682 RepID=A0ACC1TBS2_9APHY|nr:hypothetical protein NM688_g1362 [Phlebia brevispora]
MATFSHAHPAIPVHFALQHPVINDDANPGEGSYLFADGRTAMRVLVDDRAPSNVKAMAEDSLRWFPKARSEKIARKLWCRITQEGNILPIITSIAVAILAEMYTTTSGSGASNRRVRLKYKSSPIADFGVAKGVANVQPQDRLLYQRVSDGSIVDGQSPAEHYWLWFRTVRGEELELDFSMFVHNFGMIIQSKQYLPTEIQDAIGFAPVFFRGRDARKNSPSLHKEDRRLSILRDPDMNNAVAHSYKAIFQDDNELIVCFMERLSGRKVQPIERELSRLCSETNCTFIRQNLKDRLWAKYPPSPAIAVFDDPGELDDLDDPNASWAQHMHKHRRNRSRGTS